ncbi:MAG: sugar transferase [Candidatus Omnitrophica bacterium]|nr:sugar transferase [Candidatus Omnitrophota bacterium]
MKRFFPSALVKTAFTALADFLALELALLAGYWLWIAFPWHGNYQPFQAFAVICWTLPFLGVAVFSAVGLYKAESGILGVEEQSLILKAIWIIYFLGFAASFFYRQIHFSRLAITYSIFIAILIVTAERFFFRRLFMVFNQKGIGVRHALIYGAGHQGQRLERWIQQSPKLGIRVLGYLDDEVQQLHKKPERTPILGKLDDFKNLVKKKNISLLFVAYRKLPEERVIEIFQLCRRLGIQCWVIPSLYQFHVERAELMNIGGIPLVGFREGFGQRSYALIKRLLDIAISFFLIILISPLMLSIVVLVRALAGKPVFFRQIRIGLNGKKFMMIKFRTLKSKKQHQDEISPELRESEPSTSNTIPFGAFLRRTGLDELPQLFLVFSGDMSLVGPRPEMPFIVEKYGPLEKERLSVKPGITGLWQISDDRKRLLIHENMDYDLYYIEHRSFNLDLAILMKTAFTLLKRLIGTAKS